MISKRAESLRRLPSDLFSRKGWKGMKLPNVVFSQHFFDLAALFAISYSPEKDEKEWSSRMSPLSRTFFDLVALFGLVIVDIRRPNSVMGSTVSYFFCATQSFS